MNANQILQTLPTIGIAFGLKAVGAIIVWGVGRFLIGLVMRPYCHTDHYWQVYFDTNRAIRETFGAAGFPVPDQHLVLRDEGVVKREISHRDAAAVG
jgi:hypothetical protein